MIGLWFLWCLVIVFMGTAAAYLWPHWRMALAGTPVVALATATALNGSSPWGTAMWVVAAVVVFQAAFLSASVKASEETE